MLTVKRSPRKNPLIQTTLVAFKLYVKTLLPISAALLGVCFAANAQAPAKVTYAEHIAPIFRNICTNCHNPDKKKAGLDLTTYAGALAGSENGPVIKPGNADGSLMYKVCMQVEDPKMPPKGDKLSEAELALLKNWIAGFALENPGSKPAQVAANKVDAAIVSLQRPDGPPPMPGDLPMEPFVRARQGNVILAMAASPWAPLVAVGGQRQVFLFNTETTERLGVLAFPEGFPNVLRFSRNAKLLLAAGGFGGKSGKVVLWDVATGERAGTVGNETDAVLAADISPDHQFVALGGADRRLKIYQTKDGKQTAMIKKHTEWVTAISFSPDGKYLASGDRNGGIEVWETGAEPKPFNTLAGHKACVTALAFMPGVLASASEDGKVTLWNVKDGTEMKSWTAHNGGALWVEFSPDGRLATCGRDKVAKIWDATGKQIATTEAFSDLAVRCTLNGERVIATDWTGEVRVCSLDGKRIGALDTNPPAIAEQIAADAKAIAENNRALPALQEAVANAEAKVKAEKVAAESKRNADIAAVETRKAEAAKQIEATKVASVNAEKMANDLAAELAGAKDAVAKARATVGEQKISPATADDSTKVAAKKKFDELTAEITKRRDERAKFTQGTPEYARANEAVQALKPELSKAEQALAAANQSGGVIVNSAESEAVKVAIAAAKKKTEALTQQLQQAQAEMGKLKADSPKQIEAATKSIADADAEIQKLKAPAKQTPGEAEAEQAFTKAKAELDAANARVAVSKVSVEKWKRAQIYQTVFNAKQNAADKQAKYDDAVTTAKDAFRQVELTKQGLVVAQQTVADAPKTIAAKELALAAMKQGADAAKAALAVAESAVADKKTDAPLPDKPEAEIAELTKKSEAATAELTRLRAERAKFTEGTPESAKANEPYQAQKPIVAKAEEALAVAKGKPTSKPMVVAPELLEAVKKTQTDAKLAADKIAPAEKAFVEAKKSIEDAKRQIVELKARIPQLEKDAVKNKTAAEKAAAVLAKEVIAAKAEFEKLRAQYEAMKMGAKSANATPPGTAPKL